MNGAVIPPPEPADYVKNYDDPNRATAAVAHHGWLRGLDSGVRLPRLIRTGPGCLVFEHLAGRHAGPDDLVTVAEALGAIHSAAYTAELHIAHLDVPFVTDTGVTIADFVSPRRSVLASSTPIRWRDLPVTLYKDANPRNFLLTDASGTIAAVDFDDLTLAPPGYDLAKLVVTTSMTYGRLAYPAIVRSLNRYNHLLATATSNPVSCRLPELQVYAEVHHALTARYLNRGGYVHPWPAVRPWPRPPGSL